MQNIHLPKLIAIVGPTSAGKTDYAIDYAKKNNGEIISADSRQMYRGFVVGAGVTPGEMQIHNGKEVWVSEGIRHHLIGTLDPQKTITLSEYKTMAEAAIDDILQRGKTPILCGGTGLYINAVVDNYDIPEVAPQPELRAQLEQLTTEQLFALLEEKDPEYAARITRENRRYIIRALEVMHATDKPFSHAQKRGSEKYTTEIIGITREREQLQKRIAARVDNQLENGLVDEVRALAQNYGWKVSAMSGLGYKQLRPYLEIENDTNRTDAEKSHMLAQCRAEIIRETWQYAKRQMTWFKRDKRIRWTLLA